MGHRILVVDDEYDIRAVLRFILQKAGYEVEEACSGAEALQKIRQAPFSLVTMDMAMDRLDGVDTIAILNSEAKVPIVAISAHLTDPIRSDLRARGVPHLVEKPFTREQILVAVENALRG